jgi:hypothetical protein
MSQSKLFSSKFHIEYITISFSTMYPSATAYFSQDNSGKDFFPFPSRKYLLHFTQDF